MQFIDEAKIHLKSGDGGNGCVSFRREKFVAFGGPDGGDGGRGGSIIVESTKDMNTLLHYRYQQHFRAQNGESGKGQNRYGKAGEDLVLRVPVGTQIVTEDERHILYDFTQDEHRQVILAGGKGGLGNTHFKSSTNRAPRRTIPAEPGTELTIKLKLKLLCDVGLVGLPNAGKSTFISSVTAAKPKIADYPFTTIKPGLGVARIDDEEFVIADIPGLIEGAHQGKGLGDRFLKHIERCKIILHLVDITDENFLENYKTIRNELEEYSAILHDKKEIIALSKCDSFPAEEIKDKIAELQSIANSKVMQLSSISKIGTTEILRECAKNLA